MKALGILRETQNSPGRESDDALVLKVVMDQLSILKTEVTVMTPEEFDRAEVNDYDLIVPMCETYSRLMRLKKIEAETGVVMVNPSDSVLGCYRTRMLESFANTPGLFYPATVVRRSTADANKKEPDFEANAGWWLKRGDVHNTCTYDVVFAKDWDEARKVCLEFESREINDLAIQRHTDGDLIKFYGVGPGQWF
ncbi:MAG: hypothetical protein AAB268_10525, partial [Elusimicrobiota bacterium]